MEEKYCPACELVHKEDAERCCVCKSLLVERPESSDGEDHSCPFCIDHVEMA